MPGTLNNLFSLLIVLVFVIGLLWAVSRFRPVRRFFAFIASLPPAALLGGVGLFAMVFWRPVGWLADLVVRFIPLDRFAQVILEIPPRFSKNPLILGKRRFFAELVWEPEIYPDLYCQVPADIVRPLYEDGRLLGGAPITWLADRHVTEGAFRSAVRAAFKSALIVLLLILIFVLLGAVFGLTNFLGALVSGERPILEQWPGDEPVRVSFWALVGANLSAAASDLATKLAALAVYLPATAVIAVGAGLIIFLLLFAAWMRMKAEPYRLVTKDADVRWPFRIETRNLLRETYRQQVKQATGYLKDAATYAVGVATGTLRTRGDLAAPSAGQSLRLDRESLFQHLLVFGGTGEGKTTALLKPLLRQVLADRSFGAYVADAKGVLWRDAQGVAQACGRAADVMVIGAEPGQLGLDPIAQLTPNQVAATIRSVLRQASGSGGGDSFWPEMAANILRHMLTLGQAYARTPKAKADPASVKLSPYSLWWAYQAVITPDLTLAAIKTVKADYDRRTDEIAVAEKAKDPGKAEALLSALMADYSSELLASIAYLEGPWPAMAAETRTGIIASVTQLLDGFSGSPVLRERFASGRSDKGMSLQSALEGKIVLNALSSIEDGLPARLVSILIKTSLYREARVREAHMKSSGAAGSPQDRPCLVMIDEVQELATVDPASGLSDASFWNVARSTGLAGVFATQTLAALDQSMGEAAARNFVQQARSKVFFRAEDQATVDYACWSAGEFERNRVYDDGHRESIEYRNLIDGWDPFLPIDQTEGLIPGPGAYFEAALGLLIPDRLSMARAGARPTYGLDTRFIATDATPGLGGGTAGNSAFMGSVQASAWRSEDLTRQYRTQGNERQAALTPSDILHMGRWHAFAHIQRAGAARQDIIRIEHDFG